MCLSNVEKIYKETQTSLHNSDKPHGPTIQGEKEDCVNHVSKWMGTALRKLVDVSKANK